MSDKCICLVTIHGVGFEQRPTKGAPLSGYADMLHLRLSRALQGAPAQLSDDPSSQRTQAGRGLAGPVYVQSDWPPRSERREAGLARLGVWREPSHPRIVGAVDGAKAPLATPGARLAHVALVYSRMEDQGPHLGPAIETTSSTLANLGHYASVLATAHMAFNDLAAILPHHQPAPVASLAGADGMPTSLRVRGDADPRWRRSHTGKPTATAAPPPAPVTGLPTVLRQLTDDVATYIYHNDLRTRVRDFVREALLRLLYREDVAGIVVNAHSQGTTLAFDVLSQLQPFEASRTLAFVTAGSPLGKYVDLFNWGNDIGAIRFIGPQAETAVRSGARATGEAAPPDATAPLHPCWLNFWDPRDPVADPLTPATRQDGADAAIADPAAPTLFAWLNPRTGAKANVLVDDHEVNNIAHSTGGGLQAHNYWDNETEFIAPLAQQLRELASDRFH